MGPLPFVMVPFIHFQLTLGSSIQNASAYCVFCALVKPIWIASACATGDGKRPKLGRLSVGAIAFL